MHNSMICYGSGLSDGDTHLHDELPTLLAGRGGNFFTPGRQIIYQGWWVLTFPLIALFATVLAFNQLGDGLRRALDPVLQR